MNKLSFIFYRSILWLWDLISLNAALLLVSLNVEWADLFAKREYHVYMAFFNIAWLSAGFLSSLYLSKQWLDFSVFIRKTIKSFVITIVFLLVFLYLYEFQFSRFYIISSIALFGLLTLINRILFNVLVMALRSRFRMEKKVVILGYNDISKRLIRYFRSESKLVKVSGCFEDKERVNELSDFPILGGLQDCLEYVKTNNIAEIYSTLAPEKYPYLYDLAKEADKLFVHFKFVPDYNVFVNRNIYVDFVDNIPVLSLRSEPLEDTGNRIKKRLFDIAFSLFVIIFILSWLVPIVAILIKLDSRGPVFFIQQRSGKNNRPFACIKFRSLRVNDESDTKQVTRNDRRITFFGRFLRKSNIDELPQFFNVLIGDMSVVGPRPHMLKHTEDFSNIYKKYMIRHFVKPGLTGWAQVHGFRGEITNNELLRRRIEYDLWYLENWTIFMDVKIIFMTIMVTIRGDERAY
ncbi:undecaprenyl-phosphate glucose phosphotransferase [Flavihumibacter sp.]|uniref:undecaprenyl-phosphate glucose phosphotransferase n=1 Tax=Flavihumibacter sp. TaxID=1913981 RepID=UPI002FC6C409|nr:undecaprenyl-phosphate glucose phosphotransferase [Flavihumibacter sediminis]